MESGRAHTGGVSHNSAHKRRRARISASGGEGVVTVSAFDFPSASGRDRIRCRAWTPDGTVRGAVQLVHGVAEHTGRYGAFGETLAAHGYAVVGDDHLGHGLTAADASERGWFAESDGWEKLLRDERTLRNIIAAKYPGVPIILFGHSMGSFLARELIARCPGDYAGCVLSGTGHTPVIVCRLGRVLTGLTIRLRGGRYRSEALQRLAFGRYLRGVENPVGPYAWMCRDEAVVRAFDDDPLCGFTGTAELMHEMLKGLEHIARPSLMRRVNPALPVLIVSGGADPVGGWGRGVRTVAERLRRAGMTDVTLKLYPGARHELVNELNRDEVYADLLRWLEAAVEKSAA